MTTKTLSRNFGLAAAAAFMIALPSVSQAYTGYGILKASYTTTSSWSYSANEVLSISAVMLGSTADYDVYLEKLNTSTNTYSVVASSAQGAGKTDTITYTVPASGIYRWRINKYADASSYGCRYNFASAISAGGNSMFVSVPAGHTIYAACSPASTKDCTLSIVNSSSTTVASTNAGGLGYRETISYTPASTTSLKMVWGFASGTGLMGVSFAVDNYSAAPGTTSYYTYSATNGNKLKTEIADDGAKSKSSADADVSQTTTTGTVTKSGWTSECGWSFSVPLGPLAKIIPVFRNTDSVSKTGTITIARACDGRLGVTGSADFAIKHYICIAQTACICGMEVAAGPAIDGTMSDTGGNLDIGGKFAFGLHCGPDNWACGYVGGFIKGQYRIENNSGVQNSALVFKPGVEWHAKLVFVGPSGSKYTTIAINL